MKQKYQCQCCKKEILSKEDARLDADYYGFIHIICNECYLGSGLPQDRDKYAKKHYKLFSLIAFINLTLLYVLAPVAFLISLLFLRNHIYFTVFFMIGALEIYGIVKLSQARKRQANIIIDFCK